VTVRVLIADDQALVRAGFRMILESQDDIEVVGEAADGYQALGLAREFRPDVILMDIRMPDLDGIAATRQLTDSGTSGAKVIILTTYELDEYLFDALQAGASGFLLKDVVPEELIRGVRVVADGGALLAPSVTQTLIATFAAKPRRTSLAANLSCLTPRELEILTLVGTGRTNPQIAADLFISENTVKTHVARVFDKLGIHERVQAVIIAYDTGLVAPNTVAPNRGGPPGLTPFGPGGGSGQRPLRPR
jgi:DNA-binding NarL/FixJ family response regulator